MRSEVQKLCGILVLVGLSIAIPGHAATIAASSTSFAAVQAAINAAANGDTVTIPAGSSTWSSAASVPSSKKVTIQGQGVGITTITQANFDTPILDIGAAGSWVSNISFVNGYVVVDGQNWRVHHNSFDNGATWAEGVWSSSQSVPAVHTTGVVDHNTFHNSRVCINGNAYLLTDNAPGNLNQSILWNQDVTFGGPGFVFVEDNSFSGAAMIDCIDSRQGGRYVFRYNTYTDTNPNHNGYMAEFHSVHDSAARAGRAWEIYNNTIISTAGMWGGIGYIRGGTGVCFNNTVVGATVWGVILNNERDTLNAGGTAGLCDGTSPWDGNTAGQAGWRGRDQIGAGKDTSLWTASNLYPSQTSDPAYFWGNSPATLAVNLPSNPPHIVQNRDYYIGVTRPGYVPYTYPHPLTLIGGSQVPAPPTGLHISN
jgi:hypothetical protein